MATIYKTCNSLYAYPWKEGGMYTGLWYDASGSGITDLQLAEAKKYTLSYLRANGIYGNQATMDGLAEGLLYANSGGDKRNGVGSSALDLIVENKYAKDFIFSSKMLGFYSRYLAYVKMTGATSFDFGIPSRKFGLSVVTGIPSGDSKNQPVIPTLSDFQLLKSGFYKMIINFKGTAYKDLFTDSQKDYYGDITVGSVPFIKKGDDFDLTVTTVYTGRFIPYSIYNSSTSPAVGVACTCYYENPPYSNRFVTGVLARVTDTSLVEGNLATSPITTTVEVIEHKPSTFGVDVFYDASTDISTNPLYYNSVTNTLKLNKISYQTLLNDKVIDWQSQYVDGDIDQPQITRFGSLYTGGQKRPMATKPWRTDNKLALDVPDLGNIPQHSSGQEITIRNSEGDVKANIPWVKVTHPTTLKDLYIASQNLLVNVSWQELDAQDLIFGKQVEIDGKKYKLRCIEGGVSPRVAGQNYDGANPTTNEWDMFVWNETKLAGFPDPDPVNLNYTLGAMDLKTAKGTPHAKLWNWGGCHSWCLNQANYQTGAEQSIKTVRGYHTPSYFNVSQPYLKGFQIGWRPVLEPLTVDMQPYIKVVDANRLNITWKVVGVEQGITKATAELNGVEIMNKTTGVYGFMTHIINASQLLSTPNTLVIKYSNVDNVVVAEKTIKINKGVGRIPPAQTFATIGGYRVKITEALSDGHLLHLTLNTDLSKKVKSGDLVELMYNDFRPQCMVSDEPIVATAFSEMQHFKTRHLGNSIFEDCYTLKALGRYVAFKDIIIKDTQSPNPYLKDFQASFRYSSQ